MTQNSEDEPKPKTLEDFSEAKAGSKACNHKPYEHAHADIIKILKTCIDHIHKKYGDVKSRTTAPNKALAGINNLIDQLSQFQPSVYISRSATVYHVSLEKVPTIIKDFFKLTHDNRKEKFLYEHLRIALFKFSKIYSNNGGKKAFHTYNKKYEIFMTPAKNKRGTDATNERGRDLNMS